MITLCRCLLIAALSASICNSDALDHMKAAVRDMNETWHRTCLTASSTKEGSHLCDAVYQAYKKNL